MKTLQNCENMFGKISPRIEKRIKNYINKPSFDNWEDIKGLIINPEGKMTTIWNAIIEVDSSFPSKGRTEDMEGNIIEEWERIPTELQILQAIKKATI